MTPKKILLTFVVIAGLFDFTANWLAAHFLIPLGPFLVPAGTFLFSLSFTVYDFLRRQGGIKYAGSAVSLGFILSIIYTVVFGGAVGRIAVAGLIALACSSTSDLAMQTWTLKRPIWQYVGISNVVSLAIDTVVFGFIAFAGNPALLNIMLGQYIVKVIMTGVSIPLVYAGRKVTA